MKVDDFDFVLPDELIAQEPPLVRGGSRLLVLDRATGTMAHREFPDIADYLRSGDLLVLNDTKVFPARLLGQRDPSGGAVECLLVEAGDADPSGQWQVWSALVRPGQKLKAGARLLFERDGIRLRGEVLPERAHGRRSVRLWVDDDSVTERDVTRSDAQEGDADGAESSADGVSRDGVSGGGVSEAIERIGHIPLPPYIARDDRPDDRERYQTVFARHRGSIAAPTAGLHFTRELLDQLAARGIERVEVTLHVGYGTFKPVRVDDVEAHQVDPERYSVSPRAAEQLSRALREGRRIVAVGTTTTRVLESLEMDADGRIRPATGMTGTFIYPGHQFRVVSGLVTNFHLPRSSLLMLVAAFGGRERVLAAYREAVARRYRFYSYGDAMFVS